MCQPLAVNIHSLSFILVDDITSQQLQALLLLAMGVFREEHCLRDICVTFKSLFRLALQIFLSLIDYID